MALAPENDARTAALWAAADRAIALYKVYAAEMQATGAMRRPTMASQWEPIPNTDAIGGADGRGSNPSVNQRNFASPSG